MRAQSKHHHLVQARHKFQKELITSKNKQTKGTEMSLQRLLTMTSSNPWRQQMEEKLDELKVAKSMESEACMSIQLIKGQHKMAKSATFAVFTGNTASLDSTMCL